MSNTNAKINIVKMRLTKLTFSFTELGWCGFEEQQEWGTNRGRRWISKITFPNRLQFQITQVLFLYKCVLPEWRWMNKAVVKKVASHLFLPLLLPWSLFSALLVNWGLVSLFMLVLWVSFLVTFKILSHLVHRQALFPFQPILCHLHICLFCVLFLSYYAKGVFLRRWWIST